MLHEFEQISFFESPCMNFFPTTLLITGPKVYKLSSSYNTFSRMHRASPHLQTLNHNFVPPRNPWLHFINWILANVVVVAWHLSRRQRHSFFLPQFREGSADPTNWNIHTYNASVSGPSRWFLVMGLLSKMLYFCSFKREFFMFEEVLLNLIIHTNFL